MSQENVDLVRRSVKDVHLFWSLLDEDVVLDVGQFPAVDSDPVYVGRDPVIEWSRHYWGTWVDYELEAEEIFDTGPSVVLAIRESGRGRGSGAPVERRWAQVWTFREGRIIRWALFSELAEALESVGLSR